MIEKSESSRNNAVLIIDGNDMELTDDRPGLLIRTEAGSDDMSIRRLLNLLHTLDESVPWIGTYTGKEISSNGQKALTEIFVPISSACPETDCWKKVQAVARELMDRQPLGIKKVERQSGYRMLDTLTGNDTKLNLSFN